ncbi:MAG TPA: DUF1611 domain-containing protein [Allocoleopsis sp.]
MLKTTDKIVILLHEGIKENSGKTGISVVRYSECEIVAIIDYQSTGESFKQLTGINRDIPIVSSVEESLKYAPNVLLIGIAPSGGILPPEWLKEIKFAVKSGLSIVNGLHSKLGEDIEIKNLLKSSQWIWDIRQEPKELKIGSSAAKNLKCLRILTVGTDMNVGKMSTSLELHKTCIQRGLKSKFLATGQGGIMISGNGVALDAVRVDFASGVIEQLVMKFGEDNDILHIEGQGSLLHPGSTATLPLIRGSQPTDLILVHRYGQTHIKNHPTVLIPPLTEVIKLYENVAYAGGAFNQIKVAGIALNTYHLSEEEAKKAIRETEDQTGVKCTDSVRFGGDILVDEIT